MSGSPGAPQYSCNEPCDCPDPVDHAIRGRCVLDANRVLIEGLCPTGRSIYGEIVDMYAHAATLAQDHLDVRHHMQAMLNQCDPATLTRYRAVVDEVLRVLSQAGIVSSLALMEVFLWF